MLEKVIVNICDQMSEILTREQIQELKNVLYMNFHNKKIIEESTDIIQFEQDPDIIKIKMFVASKNVSGRSKSTLKKYVYDITNFKTAINKPLDQVTPMDVRWYLSMCQETRKNKLSTIEGIRSSLCTFYSFLEQEEVIIKNPMKRVEPVRQAREIKKAFSAQELEAIRSSCEDIRERALVEILYSTGVRVSEFCSINVGDIDLIKKEFVITGKGNKQRVVYISDSALFYLHRYISEKCKSRKCTLAAIRNEPLFTGQKQKTRITQSGVQWILKEIGKRANVNDVHPHRFRRTFATDLLNHGMKIEEVMVLMGHSKLDTTMVYYDLNQSLVGNSYHRCS